MVVPSGMTIPGDMVVPSGMTIPGCMVVPGVDCCPVPVPEPGCAGDEPAAVVVEHPANRTIEAASTPHLRTRFAISDSSDPFRLDEYR